MIKRYFATEDNTITNAFDDSLETRGTGSNMGESDILEVFSIYAQVSASTGLSSELSRVIIKFPMTDISADITAGTIDSNASFYLKMYNCPHSSTLPRQFDLEVQAVSASWEEGVGLDMDNYSDLTYDVVGSNWIRRTGSTSWGSQGGDVHASPIYNQSFDTGVEDLEIDVTTLVNQWHAGTKENDGFMVRLSSSLETQAKSYYTKKFFARSSEFFFKRPVLEARWDSSVRDDRGNFYASSSLASAADNLNTIYLYNYSRGRLANIPAIGTGDIYVNLYETLGEDPSTLVPNTPVTGGWVSTGIYSASVGVETSATTLRDVWYSGSTQYFTGSITVKQPSSQQYVSDANYVLSMPGLKTDYQYQQTHKLKLYARQKNWSPSIYNVASTVPASLIFESASYEIFRAIDGETIVPYGTGSSQHTRLSYDVSGNYFYLDTSILEPNYTYGIRYSIYNSDAGSYEEQPYTFKIRVVENEY